MSVSKFQISDLLSCFVFAQFFYFYQVLGDLPEFAELKESMMESFLAKYKLNDGSKEEETINSEDFTILLRSTVILQRGYRRYRY